MLRRDIFCRPRIATIAGFLPRLAVLILLNSAVNHVEAAAAASVDERLEPSQMSSLRQVVGDMIGRVPAADNSVGGGKDDDDAAGRGVAAGWSTGRTEDSDGPAVEGRLAPSYMLRLYERYRDGELVDDADTVRSIHGELALVNNESLFVFNVSCLSDGESVTRSEIYVYKKRSTPNSDGRGNFRSGRGGGLHRQRRFGGRPSRRPLSTASMVGGASAEVDRGSSKDGDVLQQRATVIRVYELTPSFLRPMTSFAVSQSQRPGWQAFDVTEVVRQWAGSEESRDTSATPRLMAVSFTDKTATAVGGSSSSMTSRVLLSNYHRMFGRPFLIVYSQQSPLNSSNEAESGEQRGHDDVTSSTAVATTTTTITKETDGKKKEKHIKADESKSRQRNRNRTKERPTKKNRTEDSTRSDTVAATTSTKSTSAASSEVDAVRRRNTGRDSSYDTTSDEKPIDLKTIEMEATEGSMLAAEHPAVALMSSASGRRHVDGRSRQRRHVLNNEVDLPDSDDADQRVDEETPDRGPVPVHGYSLPRTSPRILQGRQNRRQNGGHPPASSTTKPFGEGDEDQFADFDAEAAVVDDDEASRSNRKRGRSRESKKRGGSDPQLLPNPEFYAAALGREKNAGKSEDDAGCRKRRLMVDFADIGWGDWIISPKFFEAYYCDGMCQFPIAKKLRPTNHATIQSIVRAVGIQTGVPSPCCVPASLTSLTLLYFDENQNVVLKNYPEMSVRSCACR